MKAQKKQIQLRLQFLTNYSNQLLYLVSNTSCKYQNTQKININKSKLQGSANQRQFLVQLQIDNMKLTRELQRLKNKLNQKYNNKKRKNVQRGFTKENVDVANFRFKVTLKDKEKVYYQYVQISGTVEICSIVYQDKMKIQLIPIQGIKNVCHQTNYLLIEYIMEGLQMYIIIRFKDQLRATKFKNGLHFSKLIIQNKNKKQLFRQLNLKLQKQSSSFKSKREVLTQESTLKENNRSKNKETNQIKFLHLQQNRLYIRRLSGSPSVRQNLIDTQQQSYKKKSNLVSIQSPKQIVIKQYQHQLKDLLISDGILQKLKQKQQLIKSNSIKNIKNCQQQKSKLKITKSIKNIKNCQQQKNKLKITKQNTIQKNFKKHQNFEQDQYIQDDKILQFLNFPEKVCYIFDKDGERQSFDSFQEPFQQSFDEEEQIETISECQQKSYQQILIKELKKGIVLSKCSKNSLFSHLKKVCLSQNQIQLNYQDINSRKVKSIHLKDIISINYKQWSEGIQKHIDNIVPEKCMIIKIKDKDNKLKLLEFVGDYSELVENFSERLIQFMSLK